MNKKPSLLFVSPRYLIPADSGGKIRSSDILRGLKGGVFDVSLVSPAPNVAVVRDVNELLTLCDRYAAWPEANRGVVFSALRSVYLADTVPISVASDRSFLGRRLVTVELERKPDVVVVDFPHTAVLFPKRPLNVPSVIFTHNVEAEIFQRHAVQANGGWRGWVWRNQARKMEKFERETLKRFDAVVAVSERDRAYFTDTYGLANVHAIPTGVNLDNFPRQPARELPPPTGGTLVFTGAMDWRANLEGIDYFMDEVWPLLIPERPDLRFVIVGKNPPSRLSKTIQQKNLNWTVTGFVDDVRPYVRDADVFVIPLRIGGGTRIKAFEAMAMGRPVVSTTLGVEGLSVEPGRHYLRGDTPAEFADAILSLLGNIEYSAAIAANARKLVEDNFSSRKVAAVFESICEQAMREFESRKVF